MYKGNVLRKAACLAGRSPSPLRSGGGEGRWVGGTEFMFQGTVIILMSSLYKHSG